VKSEKQQLLRPAQAAALAGVSTVAIWKAQQRGEIRATAITSRGALYTRQALKDWKAFRKRREQQRMKPPVNLNAGLGRGVAIISIQGITQEFSMWHRRAADTIPKWGEPEITKALDLLDPFVKLWIELEERQRPFREQRKAAQAEARKRRELAHLSAVSD
jgi:hypothetical protein